MMATVEFSATIVAEVGLRRDRQPHKAGTRGREVNIMPALC
jgi:hypothetical protein